MTKVLEVFGDADYSVISFEDAERDGKVNRKELFDTAIAGKANETHVFEDDETYFEYRAYEFGAVDEAFVSFVKDEVEDYDMAKHHTFFVLEDK